jgi:lincosamide nucleotidyltransferase A/C/D/E
MMTARDVLSVLAMFDEAGVDVWIGGGWGIDALAGRETRAHRDIDLGFRSEQEPEVLKALSAAGYIETVDWRPVRFAAADADDREIDLHPLAFQPDGSALQANLDDGPPFVYPADCFATGTVDGVEVPCLSIEQQIVFHQGYEPLDRERHDLDMAVLRSLRTPPS